MTEHGATSSADDAGPRLGDVVAGKYRIDRCIGRGGMGMVVAATHLALGEQVALKFLLPHLAANDKFGERFLREARAAVRIKSDHIARVLDFGSAESGEPFIVMELLEGVDLGQVLRSRGRLPVSEAVDYILQACEAIAAAHALGIVHRDLKPANLFVTKRPDGSPLVKVLDFGISKVDSSAELELTNTAEIIGSPLYMSPEQVRNPRAVDGRTDIWSLGALLYKLLTGESPFKGESTLGTMAMIIEHAPKSSRALRPEVPAELAAVIDRCLAKDPAERIQHAVELGMALAPFASDPRRALERLPDSVTISPSVVQTPLPLGGAGWRAPRRRSWITGGVGALVAGGVLAALLSLLRRPSAPLDAAPASAAAATAAVPTATAAAAAAAAAPESALPAARAPEPPSSAVAATEDTAPGATSATGVALPKAAAPANSAAKPFRESRGSK